MLIQLLCTFLTILNFTDPWKVSQYSSLTAGNIQTERRTGPPVVEGSVNAHRKVVKKLYAILANPSVVQKENIVLQEENVLLL